MPSPCIIGFPLGTNGYVQVSVNGRLEKGHRLVWQNKYGNIPGGMVLHHVCDTKACLNIDHLRLVTREEHGRLHWGCDHGSTERVVNSLGRSVCMKCTRDRVRHRYQTDPAFRQRRLDAKRRHREKVSKNS